MSPPRSPPRSLKARALQLLSQREQSRVELRRKLLAYLRADERRAAAALAALGEEPCGEVAFGEASLGEAPLGEAALGEAPFGKERSGQAALGQAVFSKADNRSRGASADDDDAPPDPASQAEPADAASRVEAVLDWLEAHRFASDERFAESRIHARSARFGNLRIRQELKQHAVVLTPEAKQALDESEEARAASVYRRRFGVPAETAAEKAKRARFLAARGFSPEVVRRVLRAAACRNSGDGGEDTSD